MSCAAGKAAFEVLLREQWIAEVKEKGLYLKEKLQHPDILQINEAGLWISLQFESDARAQSIAHACVMNGLITDWFLFAPDRLRIAPPLCITYAELDDLTGILLQSIL